MKKSVIAITLILILVILGLVFIPLLFKDQIKNAVDREIANNLHARVYFDPDEIGVSLFKHFPDVTLTLRDFGIVGVDQFAEDTLATVQDFGLTVDIISLLFSDRIKLSSIYLYQPRIFVLVEEGGQANYDILIEQDEENEAVTEESSEGMSISIENWLIDEGRLVYFDYTSDFLMALDGIRHSGSGNFSADNFDMTTFTRIDRMMASLGDVEYLKDKTLQAEVNLKVDLPNQKYTLMDNSFLINDFNFGIEGFLEILPDHYNVDMVFHGFDNSIKSIISLIPGAYTEEFKAIQAEGLLDFQGILRGRYDDDPVMLPSFSLNLIAENGRVQYPDLPEVISGINFDLHIDNPTGNFEYTSINLKQLNMNLGDNPLGATLKISNLKDYEIDATINAHLDLGEVHKYYPLEDTDLSGRLDAELTIQGVYDTLLNTIPVHGKLNLADLNYNSMDLRHALTVNKADITFDNQQMKVNELSGRIGKSDMSIKGYVSNYIDYSVRENATLEGVFDFDAQLVDLNEWATDEDSSAGDEDTTSQGIVKVPENIDFTLDSRIGTVYYDNLELNDFRGQILVRDGILHLNDIGFNSLGGVFAMKGSYDTSEEGQPKFGIDLDIKELSIPKAYANFITIQKLAPIAGIMEGNFSTDFSLSGKLKDAFTPDLTTLTGKGSLGIAQAAIQGSKSTVISGITRISNLNSESTNVGIRNIILSTEIEDGMVFTQPFNVRFGEHNALIAGSSGLDGSLDYDVKLDVPASMLETADALITSLTGKDIKTASGDVKLNLNVAGKYDDPKITVVGIDAGESQQAAEEALKAKVEQEKEKAIEKVESIIDSEKEEAPEEVKQILDEHEEEIDKAKEKLIKFFKKKEEGQ